MNAIKQVGQGKVRNIFDLGDGRLILYTTDRVSAFDVVLPSLIPQKGTVLNAMSAFWFDFTRDIIPNHMISIRNIDMPAEFWRDEFLGHCMLVKKLRMLPVECIVRGYITGSGWESYKQNGTVCGIKLPEGLVESQKLPKPIFTPTTKAVAGHDRPISFDEMKDIVGENYAEQIREISLDIYNKCALYAMSKGVIIADTKFEFGVDENGKLVLADEVLTPDSSRFWSEKEYVVGKSQKSYDKQILRNWLKSKGWNGEEIIPELPYYVVEAMTQNYEMIYEQLTGRKI